MRYSRARVMAGSIAVCFTVAGVGGCGGPDSKANRPAHPLKANEVTKLYPKLGHGQNVKVSKARTLPGGKLQAQLMGFACGAPTELNVTETSSAITISARAVNYAGDSPCTANLVPWWVNVPLKKPLGQRELRTGGSNVSLYLEHCKAPVQAEVCPDAG